jgi:hypothetical protein
VIHASGLIGAQTSSVNPFSAATVPILLYGWNGTLTTSACWKYRKIKLFKLLADCRSLKACDHKLATNRILTETASALRVLSGALAWRDRRVKVGDFWSVSRQ